MIYLGLFFLVVFFFDKAMYCGYNVDDINMRGSIRDMKKNAFSDGKITLQRVTSYIRSVLYGAGLFKNEKQEHLFTLIIHYVNCCLVYAISNSILVTSLWMLNPVNNQTTIWLNGRRYQLSLLCVLLSWKFNLLFLPAYSFAMLLHQSAFCLPLLMFYAGKHIYLLPIAFVCFFIFGYKDIKEKFKTRKEAFVKGSELHKITPKKLILVVKGLGFYFFHTLIPLKPRMYHEFLYYFSRYESSIKKGYSIWNLEFFQGVFVIGFISYEFFFQKNLWAFWWFIFQIQWTPAYPVTMMVADRYTTISSIGLMMILVKYILLLPMEFAIAIYACFMMLYFLKYQPLFVAYLSRENFFEYHINLQPDGVEARWHLAIRALQLKDPFTAFAILKKGLLYRPKDFKLLFLMSNALYVMGRIDKCYEYIAKAREVVPLGEEKDFDEEVERLTKDPKFNTKPNIFLNREARRRMEKAKTRDKD